MSLKQTRVVLVAVFLVFLTMQVIAIVSVSGRMWPEDLETLLVKLLGIYAVHLGVILAGIFAQSDRATTPPSTATWTAIVLVVLWNLLLSWRTLRFGIASEDSVSDLVRYLDTIASTSSFLVAGGLTFFFTKSSESGVA